MGSREFVICGTLVHSTEEDPMAILKDKCLGVKDGKVSTEVRV